MNDLQQNQDKQPSAAVTAKVREIMGKVSNVRNTPPLLYDGWYKEIQAQMYEVYGLVETLTATIEDRVIEQTFIPLTLDTIFDSLRPKVVVKEKLITQGLPDGEEPIVRECFETAVKNQNLPLKRQGYSYRSSYTYHAWALVFETINLIRNRIMDEFRAKEKEKANEQSPTKEVPNQG